MEIIAAIPHVVSEVMTHSFTLMIMGMLLYFLKSLAQIKKGTGMTITIKQYYVDNKWHTLFSVVSAMTVYFLLFGTAELTKVSAFTIGFMADSVADLIGQRSTIARPGSEPAAPINQNP